MSPVSIEQAFQSAVEHHQAGRLQQAETLYRQILAQQPRHAQALHYLGVIARQVGRNDAAVDLIGQSIVLQPNYYEAHFNLGNALKGKGQLGESIAAFRRSIELEPNFPQAHNNLANVLNDRRQFDEAIVACRRAIALKPDFPGALCNLGIALHATGQLEEAIAAYREAIVLKPDFPEVYNNLGIALKNNGQLDEAIAVYRQAIVLAPLYAEPHSNLGNVLKIKGNLDEAIAMCRQAIALKPDFSEAHNNLGNALQARGQLDEAIASFRRTIALTPGYAEAYGNLGVALKKAGNLDESIAVTRQAMSVKPNFSEAHSNLIFDLHCHPGYDAQAISEELRRWKFLYAEPLRRFIQPHSNNRDPDRRLRIGYVSADFREHPAGRFILPLLAHHDKQQVEVFAYAQATIPDAMTHRLGSYADQWRSIARFSDPQAADLIRRDQIDILVDLSMHTAGNRLLVFARKPAPVQVTYLAYPSSTGLTTIDYRLSDPYIDPPGGDESFYSEQTIRLPQTYWCYQPSGDIPDVGPSPAGKNGSITFGCLNNFYKVNETTLHAWARILQSVPNSQLLLHADEGSHRQKAYEQFAREGIDAMRLWFVAKVSMADYFRLYHEIDIALDPFPYGGGTTTCEALWMGVPVVSLAGQTAVGRGGLSILSNIGLPELAARSQEQYVRIAGELAGNLPRLSELRSTLRRRMEQSPLMDAPGFARNVESAYRGMWRAWCIKAK